MEFNSFSLWGMIALNALVCILLPFVVNFNWSDMFSSEP